MRDLGFHVDKEKQFNCHDQILRPDIVASKDDTAYIIDAQIVGDQGINAAHVVKRLKYQNIRNFDATIKTQYRVENVRHFSYTMSYRGIWAKKSIRE